ncbi:MAG: spore coat protein U domain-containing protein [Deltaproteobacteria bacterium]|nr:spore coat protein U domain-containing protein [Deltaproteobacteria bacterium]MCW5809112.1 spore coat protein U domain-containing protein [Deltaproteobacteria bacterium]
MKTLGVAVVACFAGMPSADAGSASSNMNVSATVVSSCSISAGALAFPNYDTVTGAQVDGTATLSVSCSKGAITSITLGQGSNAAAGSTDLLPARRMKNGTDFLSYALFSDPTRLVTWGNTLLTGLAYISTTSAPTNISVYGRVNALQDVPSGTYTDVVVATISF